MAPTKPRTLSQALGWLLAGVIAPLLLGTVALLAFQASQERQLARVRLSALAQTLSHAVDAELHRGHAQLEVLGAAPSMDGGNWEVVREFAGRITQGVPGSLIVLVAPGGQVLFNTAVPWGQPLPNLWQLGAQSREATWEGRRLPLSSGNLSREAIEQGRTVYSDLYYGVQIFRPALSMAIPVLRDGKPRYALIMSYPPSLLQQMIDSSVDVPGIRTAVVDRRGLVVAANASAAPKVAERAPSIKVPPGTMRGFYDIVSRDGTPLTGAYAVSARNGFVVRVSQPSPGLLPNRGTSLALLALVAAALAASILLARKLGRRIADPLHALGEAAAAGRAPPAATTGIAEIDVLGQALRDGVQAERQRSEEQALRLVAQTQEGLLRQADRQKDEFLATLAHELRNPLAPILNAVELIRRRPIDATTERARATIERQTRQLARLVDDLLDVSRITLGHIQLRREPVRLGDIAQAAVDAARTPAAQGSVELLLDVASPSPTIDGDVTRLSQCVANVLNNAIKFTPAGGSIRVRVAREAATAIVEVADTGVGVAAANIERIFELFVQERQSGSGGNSGLGIGLALTRKLVELHGGTIRASSAGPGLGTLVRIELPILDAPVDAVEPGSGARADGDGLRILVVDDNADAASTLGELLALGGYATEVVHDGESAVRAAARWAPHVVLLDIGLPDIDGYEACRRIRAQAGPAAPLLVALTGWGQAADKAAASTAGFDAHLTKPVAPDDLLALVEAALRERGGRSGGTL